VPIITLTSDYGPERFYAGILRGALFAAVPGVDVVDLSHDIRKFSAVDAALVLRSSVAHFPKGTIHIIAVSTESTAENPHRIVRIEDQYFIGADTGTFHLIFGKEPDAVYDISSMMADFDYPTFPERSIFVPAAAHLARGGIPELIGRPAGLVNPKNVLQPVYADHVLTGHVIYIDGYGNCITDIDKNKFREVGTDRSFVIVMRSSRSDIRKIHNYYSEVPVGDSVAVFNHLGLLEIAVFKGAPDNGNVGAAGLLGIKLDDVIRIEFAQ